MDLLKLVNNEISIAPHALGIKEFATIWNSDKSKDKNKAILELSFIYNYCYWNSIYKGYNDTERMNVLKEDILSGKEISDNITNGIAKYKEIQEHSNPKLMLLLSQRGALLKMKDYYDGVDWNQRDDKGNLIYKPKEVTAAIKDSKVALSAMDDLETQIKREQSSTSTVRGGAEIGQFEEGY